MHPLFASRARFVLYLSAWIPVTAALAGLDVSIRPRPWAEAFSLVAPLAVIYAFMCLSALWVCRAAPLGRTPPARVLANVVTSALVTTAVWTGVGMAWARLLGVAGVPGAGAHDPREVVLLAGSGIALYLFSAVVHYLVIAFEDSREAERRTLELRVSARDAELRALRAQVDPHFLFNALNSISALAGSSPEGARRMCERLGDFLRSGQRLGSQEEVSLAEEWALAERYLEIERVRFGDRLSVERRIAPEAETCLVPALLLQPLIENAIRHGVGASLRGGTVRIEARRVGDRLEIGIENPVDREAPVRHGQGLGLANVRSRLELLDPRATRLESAASPESFRVRLTLPARERGVAAGAAPESRP